MNSSICAQESTGDNFCALCGKQSHRKCAMCMMHWHPSCCDIVLRSVPSKKFHSIAETFPGHDIMKSSVDLLGQDAWRTLMEFVVPVKSESSSSSSSSARLEPTENVDSTAPSMLLRCKLKALHKEVERH